MKMNIKVNADNIIKMIFYPLLVIFIGIFIFISYKTFKSYKKRNPTENKVSILENSLDGTSAEIISDTVLPSSIIGNNYSLTFNLKLDSNSDKTKEYTIFSRGSSDEPELKLVILPYSESNSNTLRFYFKINNLDEDNDNDNVQTSNNKPLTEIKQTDTKKPPDTFQNTTIQKSIQSNTINFKKVYNQDFFNTIDYNNKNNKISNYASLEPFADETIINETETGTGIDVTMNEVNQNNSLNQNECNNVTKIPNYDYCDLINNNTDTTFHIGITVYNNIIDIYRDSELVSSCVLKGDINPSMLPFIFLSDGGFNGSIGQFNYYNITLNTEQIQTIYQSDVNAKLPRNIFSLNNN